jgi:hypothetical protein
MGIICSCLPVIGGPVVGVLVKVMAYRPTPREGTSKKSSLKTLVTIGGGSAKGINRPAFSKVTGDDGTGSFERLNDIESAGPRPPSLWPQGYQGERQTTVTGRPTTGATQSDDIPLTSIAVRQEVSWAESKSGGQ